MFRSIIRSRLLITIISILGVLVLIAGCSGSNGESTSPPATTPTSSAGATVATQTTLLEQVEETATPVPTSTAEPAGRSMGEYDDIPFIVSDGSEATFTVEEQLVRLPLPNDAVLRTTALSGEVHLDGRPSVIQIDLQKLSSDQNFRDQYIRNRMFGQYPIATFTVSNIGPIPDGFASGEEVMSQVTGSLEIRGSTYLFEFDIEGRDDGDRIYILGRTSFTWDQLEIPRPTAQSVASIEDEVRVEILLALVAQDK